MTNHTKRYEDVTTAAVFGGALGYGLGGWIGLPVGIAIALALVWRHYP